MIRRAIFSALLVASATVVGATLIPGCATTPSAPPISSTQQHLPGKIIWHDLLTHDLDAASAFYSKLLGWDFERLSDSYGQFRHAGRLVAGIAEVNPKELGAYWLPLMSVDDVDRRTEEIEQAGGKILKKPFEISGRGRVAVVTDPQGAAFAVARTTQGDPADARADFGDWLWNEVWTDNPDLAAAFYIKLSGYQEASRQMAGRPYRFLRNGEIPRLGIPMKPDPKIKNTWVSYIRVADPSAMAKLAAELGGKVVLAPRPDIRDGSVAILRDPTGGAFLVQKWPIQ